MKALNIAVLLFLLFFTLGNTIDQDSVSFGIDRDSRYFDELIYGEATLTPEYRDYQERQIKRFGERNMLFIDNIQIFNQESQTIYSLGPGESIRLDYLDYGLFTMDVFFSNYYFGLVTNKSLAIRLYDVRLRVSSPDSRFEILETTQLRSLADSDVLSIVLRNHEGLPRGTYPIDIAITGRDVTRTIHSDRVRVYLTVNEDAQNLDATYMTYQKERSNATIIAYVLIGIMIVIILSVGAFFYFSNRKQEDEPW